MVLRDVTYGLKENRDKALVAFFTAGYPDPETFRSLVRAADAAGCDLIEIGIPFSDPIADGPLIQESSKRALDNGMTLALGLQAVRELSQEIAAPLLLMSYYNPILRMGEERFAELAARARVAGAVVPDVPFEESDAIRSVLKRNGMTYVDLVAPTSGDDRMEAIARLADGFLYLVSVTGVTGSRSPHRDEIATLAERVREKTSVPLYVGFGISNVQTARAIVNYCDGVIIGSALVRLIKPAVSSRDSVEKVGSFLSEIKAAVVSRP